MTLQIHLGAKTSRPGNGPDTGVGRKQATTAGLGPETDGLGASSCLSDSVDGGGFDGVDGGLGGVEWWRRWLRWRRWWWLRWRRWWPGSVDGVDGGLVASMASNGVVEW